MNPIRKLKSAGSMVIEAGSKWFSRDPFRNSTVIAYYTIFSLPGLLVILVNMVGYFWGEQFIADLITEQTRDTIGRDSARVIQVIMNNVQDEDKTRVASWMGFATLLFGATGLFYQIQQSLNMIWEVEVRPGGQFLKFLKDRIFSFGLILTVGFLLLVSLILSTFLGSVSDWVSQHFSESLAVLFSVLDIVLSLTVITVLFAAIFKILPDAEISWRDVWVGAVVTAVLFVVAKFVLGFYFGHSRPGLAYGTAGSIVLILLWVSYTTMVLLFGAEFTKVYAERRGRRIPPSEIAVAAPEKDEEV